LYKREVSHTILFNIFFDKSDSRERNKKFKSSVKDAVKARCKRTQKRFKRSGRMEMKKREFFFLLSIACEHKNREMMM